MTSAGGRPRDSALDGRVVEATVELLREKGFRGLRMAEVAERAGVPKSSIYRRWPSLTELAVDAMARTVDHPEQSPGDDPSADLDALLVAVHATMTAPLGRALLQVGLDLLDQPEVAADYRRRLVDPLRAAAITAVRRGNDLGRWQVADPALAVDMVVGALVYRLLVLRSTPSLTELRAAVRQLTDT
ncbi:TetR/AcrR family transcriptional regulator [Naumannella sp. ID2617S]|nr:TetR/AcrR family transcriptional regulator [Naumannella sp. ID2617S]